MKLEIHRNVVSDLWPAYRSGDASAETRALVEAYLETDREFEKTLRASEDLAGLMPSVRLSPEAERRLLDQARDRARLRLLLAGTAIGATALIALIALGGALFVVLGGA